MQKKNNGFFLLILGLGFFMFVVTAHATTIGTDITTDDVVVEGNATVGNATSTDRLFLNARIASSVIPTVNNVLDMGEYDRAWNDLFASGTVYASSTLVGAGTAGAPALSFSSFGDTGFYHFDTGVVGMTSEGTATLVVGSRPGGVYGIFPISNDSRDLGTYFSSQTNFGAWNDVYASGTIYASSTLANVGYATSPSYSFAQDTDTGFFLGDVGGPLAYTINGTGQVMFDHERIAPLSNASLHLGRFNDGTSGAWADVFASGTVYAASSTLHNIFGSSTIYAKSSASGKGGQIILEDHDGNGCTAIVVNNGSVTAATATCPE